MKNTNGSSESNGFTNSKEELIEKIKTDRLITQKVFDNMNEGVLITNMNEEVLYVNRAFQKVTGYTAEEVLGNKPTLLQSGLHEKEYYEEMWTDLRKEDFWEGEIWNRRKNGEVYPEWLEIYAIKNLNNVTDKYVALFSDISKKKEDEKQLEELTYTDQLTGVHNRYALNKLFARLLKKAERNGSSFAIIFLDLDRFQCINDTLGHKYGDELLRQFPKLVQSFLNKDDIIARIGGDEFVVVSPALMNEIEAHKFSEKIIKSLERPFDVFGQEIYITSSIGASLYPADGTSLDVLLRNADKAMYFAKMSGRNAYRLYRSTMHCDERHQMQMENHLRKALERDEFYLQYQPIIHVKKKEIVSIEALIRWNQPELGLISPGQFIPLAEETSLIIPISEWVIKEACLQLTKIHAQGYRQMNLSINISAIHFNQEDFVESIGHIFKETNVKRDNIILEITESMIMSRSQSIIDKLVKLKQLGVKIAIDDFGTGYSSLSYLNRFPIDTLKIDRSFIQHVIDYKEDAAIVEVIIMLAKILNLSIVAEGVESRKQYEYLERAGCEKIQGFYITRPLMPEDLMELLDYWDPDVL